MPTSASKSQRISTQLKVAYSAFVAVLVPTYYNAYGGVAQFFYFCDLALFTTWLGLLSESDLVLSLATLGTLIPQLLWQIDFFSLLLFNKALVTEMSLYMFDPMIPLFIRSLSLFHVWLPFLILKLLIVDKSFKYDPRAFIIASLLGVVVMLICYFLLPPPGSVERNWAQNVNYAYGLNGMRQIWFHPLVWLGITMLVLALLMFFPVHLILKNSRFCVRWDKHNLNKIA